MKFNVERPARDNEKYKVREFWHFINNILEANVGPNVDPRWIACRVKEKIYIETRKLYAGGFDGGKIKPELRHILKNYDILNRIIEKINKQATEQ